MLKSALLYLWSNMSMWSQERCVWHFLASGVRFSLRFAPKPWNRCTVLQVGATEWSFLGVTCHLVARFSWSTFSWRRVQVLHIQWDSKELLCLNTTDLNSLHVDRNWWGVQNHRGMWLVESWGLVVWTPNRNGKPRFCMKSFFQSVKLFNQVIALTLSAHSTSSRCGSSTLQESTLTPSCSSLTTSALRPHLCSLRSGLTI